MGLKKIKSLVAAIPMVILAAGFIAPDAHAIVGIALAPAVPIPGTIMVSIGLLNAATGGEITSSIFPMDDQRTELVFADIMSLVLLDRKITTVPALSKPDLLDNGYSSARADTILSDQNRFYEKLAQEKKTIVIKSEEGLSSIREEVRSFLPDASDDFVGLFSDRLSMMVQEAQDSDGIFISGSPVKKALESPGVSVTGHESGAATAD